MFGEGELDLGSSGVFGAMLGGCEKFAGGCRGDAERIERHRSADGGYNRRFGTAWDGLRTFMAVGASGF